jgi:hypothetical protein
MNNSYSHLFPQCHHLNGAATFYKLMRNGAKKRPLSRYETSGGGPYANRTKAMFYSRDRGQPVCIKTPPKSNSFIIIIHPRGVIKVVSGFIPVALRPGRDLRCGLFVLLCARFCQ